MPTYRGRQTHVTSSLNRERDQDLRAYALQLSAGELPQGWDIVYTSSACLVASNRSLQIYYKEFPLPSPIDRLVALFRGSRAARWRKHSDALKYAGIEAPESLAWGKLPNGSEYLFTRTAAGQDVTTWLRKTLTERAGAALTSRRLLLESLGIFIGRLHVTGFLPGDLEASDVLAEMLDDRFQFTLINNEHSIKKLPPPGRMLLKNLMELNLLPPSVLSKTDRMRFFVAWRRQMRDLSPIEAKVLAAEAYHWAMQLMDERGQL
jgi:hypothetical protein